MKGNIHATLYFKREAVLKHLHLRSPDISIKIKNFTRRISFTFYKMKDKVCDAKIYNNGGIQINFKHSYFRTLLYIDYYYPFILSLLLSFMLTSSRLRQHTIRYLLFLDVMIQLCINLKA